MAPRGRGGSTVTGSSSNGGSGSGRSSVARAKAVAQLVEMGASRAAAKSALRASRWDVGEAAVVVFDDKHADALDNDDSDESDGETDNASGGRLPGPAGVTESTKGKAREQTPADDDEEDGDGETEQTLDAGASDDDMENATGEEYGSDDEDEQHGVGFEELDDEEDADVDYGDGDAYGFLEISKDRKETIKEVEEPVRKLWISLDQRGDWPAPGASQHMVEAELFGLQRWLSGCPEGNEQQQLFPLYNTLAGDPFTPSKCPHGCGQILERHESDFFAIPPDFLSYLSRLVNTAHIACPRCGKGVCLACGETNGSKGSGVSDKGKDKAVDPAEDDSKVAAYASQGGKDVLLHCPNMQAVLLGVGLFMAQKLWDDAASIRIEDTSQANPRKRKMTPSGTSSPEEADTPLHWQHYRDSSRYHKAGTGYGGPSSIEDGGLKAAQKRQQTKDQALADLLALVREYLPNRNRAGPFRNSDHMPAGQTLAHLRRRFNPMASHLLSAESLSDMSDRKPLYTEFMAWLELMSAHENLAGLMGQPIMRPTSITVSEGASNNSSTPGQPAVREKLIVFESNPGPRELLERILAQVKVAQRVADAAKAYEDSRRELLNADDATPPPQLPASSAKGKSRSKADGNDGKQIAGLGGEALETQRLLEFCETISKAVDKIDSALRQSKRGKAVLALMSGSQTKPAAAGGSADQQANKCGDETTTASTHAVEGDEAGCSSESELRKRYEDWAKSVAYGHYDWSMPESKEERENAGAMRLGPRYKHSYSTEASAIASYPKRNMILMKEHAVLSSTLPANWDSSVFLKIDEARPDVIKALIVGPDNTPYENGCFLFDILLGGTYNETPPSVKSMTTKGGHYRLNPNLYACGKVCLSLLGTWSGPGWQAGKSTLLQVLVSIQAMILCPEPIANEPGFERDLGTDRSKAYNANVRRMVVHIAMLEYLKNEAPEGFGEVIDTHFRLKAKAIKAQLDKWLAEDDKAPLVADSMSSIHVGRSSAAGVAGVAGSGSGSQFAREVGQVKEILDRLERGEDIRTGRDTRKGSSSSRASGGQ